ncbi:MAG TPA: PQQ-dependent sugar dehydrogenase [Thermoanaerobaculia bacterium]|nr:PQQ-dependent sugar dehydrogenase [Thermoanaerobaculia bacterium]
MAIRCSGRFQALGGLLLGALALAAPVAAAPPPGTLVQSVLLTGGLSSPIGVTNAGDGSGRLFIVERCGQIRIFENGALRATPFLNLGASPGTDVITCGDERGLLGLAFHPDYESNGLFYVFYTRKADGALTVARYQVSGDPNVAGTSGTVLLTISHPNTNHNGGQLAFGPDGDLYIATGDGGGGGDPGENAQNLSSLLGKILRIDVDVDDFPADPARNYGIPPGNPFAGATAGADEIWAYGLRNPWRFGFDRLTGDLYIGDVGQGNWEEVDFQPASSTGGENYGWDVLEGAHCFEDVPSGSCTSFLNGGSVLPILEYDQTAASPGHCAVTGGYVFRNLPAHSFFGQYLYGDFCSGFLWRASESSGTWSSPLLLDTSFGISSFGEGETGRLYLTDLFGNSLRWVAPYTFQDVPPTHWAWPFVEAIYGAEITAGCSAGSPPSFCPGTAVNRAQMAIFLLKGIHGATYVPPPATGTVFADVAAGDFAAAWIEQLFNEGLAAGCATNPRRFCPTSSVTRAEIAVFLLKAKHGSTYGPPPGTGTVFSDVPPGYWAVSWIEQLYAEGGTGGCGNNPLRYCPTDSVARAQAAAFLSRTFSLPLP